MYIAVGAADGLVPEGSSREPAAEVPELLLRHLWVRGAAGHVERGSSRFKGEGGGWLGEILPVFFGTPPDSATKPNLHTIRGEGVQLGGGGMGL